MAYANSDYIPVSERISRFRDLYKDGSLQPWNPERPYDIVTVDGKTFIVVVAAAYRSPDDQRPGVGMAWEPYPAQNANMRGSELMVCETSAWGRAIVAVLAADTKRGVASEDEMAARVMQAFPSAEVQRPSAPQRTYPSSAPAKDGGDAKPGQGKASPKQVNFIRKLVKEKNLGDENQAVSALVGRTVESLLLLSSREASVIIDGLLNGTTRPAAPEPQPGFFANGDPEEPF